MSYEYDLCIGDIAERWMKFDGVESTPETERKYCTHVSILVETGELKANHVPFIVPESSGLYNRAFPKTPAYESLKPIIPNAEIFRYESEHPDRPIISAQRQTAEQPPEHRTPQKLHEKPADYVSRRRLDGAPDHVIAKELRGCGIGYFVIGLHIEPSPRVGKSGYEKRGKKWVSMTD